MKQDEVRVSYYKSIDTYIIDGIEFRPAKNIAPEIYVSQFGSYIKSGDINVKYGTETYRTYKGEKIPTCVLVCVGRYTTKSGKSAGRAINLGRLVLDAWNQREDESNLDVDHIDNNPFNNKLSNLRWLTHQENVQRARHKDPVWTRTEDVISKRSRLYNEIKESGIDISFNEYQRLSRHNKRLLFKKCKESFT